MPGRSYPVLDLAQRYGRWIGRIGIAGDDQINRMSLAAKNIMGGDQSPYAFVDQEPSRKSER